MYQYVVLDTLICSNMIITMKMLMAKEWNFTLWKGINSGFRMIHFIRKTKLSNTNGLTWYLYDFTQWIGCTIILSGLLYNHLFNKWRGMMVLDRK